MDRARLATREKLRRLSCFITMLDTRSSSLHSIRDRDDLWFRNVLDLLPILFLREREREKVYLCTSRRQRVMIYSFFDDAINERPESVGIYLLTLRD